MAVCPENLGPGRGSCSQHKQGAWSCLPSPPLPRGKLPSSQLRFGCFQTPVGARPPARGKRGGCQRGGLLRRQVPRSAPTRDPDLLNGTLHLGQIQVRITTRWTVHQNWPSGNVSEMSVLLCKIWKMSHKNRTSIQSAARPGSPLLLGGKKPVLNSICPLRP